MRRGIGPLVLVLLIAGGVALGVGAYHAGVNHGEAQALVDTSNGQVVHVVEAGHAWGFFPFGLFLFPVLFFGLFALLRIAFWGGAWGRHDHPHGPGRGSAGPMAQRFEEWHRTQHQDADTGGTAPPAPAA